MNSLPKPLQSEAFTLQKAMELGMTRYELRNLVNEGSIEILGHGIYRVVQEDLSEEDQYRLATLQVGSPSAVCLVSALAYHELTDVIPRQTWVMVPAEKRSKYANLKLLRSRNPQWKIGIDKKKGYSVTNLERTLVDTLCARARLGTQVGIDALKGAVATKKTTLSKVMNMAVRLGVSHRIQAYIEALS